MTLMEAARRRLLILSFPGRRQFLSHTGFDRCCDRKYQEFFHSLEQLSGVLLGANGDFSSFSSLKLQDDIFLWLGSIWTYKNNVRGSLCTYCRNCGGKTNSIFYTTLRFGEAVNLFSIEWFVLAVFLLAGSSSSWKHSRKFRSDFLCGAL